MRQTLFWIPYEAFGVPIFGFGVLLALWLLIALGWAWHQSQRGVAGKEIASQLPMMLIIAAAILFLPDVFKEALPIRGYGVMLLLAVVCGVGLAARRAQQAGMDPEIILSLAVWLFVAGIFGARLFHVIQYWKQEYVRPSAWETFAQVINIPQGGLVVYGSLIGGAIAFFVFTHRHKLPTLALADLIAPSVMLGIALGRIGCLMNGCCFGGLCELPWQVTFPPGSPPYFSQVDRGMLPSILLNGGLGEDVAVMYVPPNSQAAKAGLLPGSHLTSVNGIEPQSALDAYRLIVESDSRGESAVLGLEAGGKLELPLGSVAARSLPVHPTQVYSAVNALLLCGLLLAAYPFRTRDGETFALMATLYPISRFMIEIIRTDESAVLATEMSISQIVSLLIVVGIVCLWVFLFTRPRGVRTLAASC